MATIKFRRGPTSTWTTANPTLQQGEPGFDLTTNELFVGDGTTAKNSLVDVVSAKMGVNLATTGGTHQILKQLSTGVVTVAALVAAEIPSLPGSIITSGQVGLAEGGTNADNTAVVINEVWAGPASGSTGSASYRALVPLDLPKTVDITAVTASYAVLAADNLVRVNDASANALTLPAATGTKRNIKVKNVGAGACTVTCAGSDHIDGAATVVLAQYGFLSIVDAASAVWDVVS
jgi:hypothetical protein